MLTAPTGRAAKRLTEVFRRASQSRIVTAAYAINQGRMPDLKMPANQEATRDWWDNQKEDFDVFVSEAVIEEASVGDVDAVRRRIEIRKDVPELDISDQARELARALVAKVPLSPNAQIDAPHIAVATVHGMHYLLTWNCRHIANAALRRQIEAVCRSAGCQPPILCTPLEPMED